MKEPKPAQQQELNIERLQIGQNPYTQPRPRREEPIPRGHRVHNLEELLRIYNDSPSERDQYVVNFGKYKGQKVSQVPNDYIRWATKTLEQDRLKEQRLKELVVAKTEQQIGARMSTLPEMPNSELEEERKLKLFIDEYEKIDKKIYEEMNVHAYEAFIRPLRIKEENEKEIILFSRDARWLNEHYHEIIKNLLNDMRKLIITSEI